MDALPIRVDLVIPAKDLRWRAVRSSGPGGQHVNKVATKVDLRFDLPGTTALSEAVKSRLRSIAGERRLDADGWIIVTGSGSRSREENLGVARRKLQRLIARALVPRKKRRPTRPTKASQRRRVEAKRRRAETKRARSRVPRD